MNDLLSPGINVLIDGQWGSTGKGKLGSYLALESRLPVEYATADFQPNSGHTAYVDGKPYVLHCIPSGFACKTARLFLSPASTIEIETFLAEVDMLEEAGFEVSHRLYIHPNVTIVTAEDKEEERRTMKGIASTMKGTGAALARKIKRKAQTAKDFPELSQWVHDLSPQILLDARQGAVVLAETAQGFDLSLNYGKQYPYVTSRDVTTSNVLANIGAPPQLMSRCWASMRTFPIRVGNPVEDGVEVGFSGPHYPDQHELTWDEITRNSGSQVALLERTTVTKRVRRVFTWSWQQYRRFLQHCQPTDIFLNFVNYLDNRSYGQQTIGHWENIGQHIAGMRLAGEEELEVDAPQISLLGTGPDHHQMIQL